MIFQHTLNQVLSGAKTATSRLWKDNWAISFVSPDSPEIRAIYSCHDKQPFKRLRYEVGQILSAQPARGQKGVAKIRILELQKRDVRTYSESEILAEGYGSALEFYKTWYGMHFPAYVKLLADGYVDYDWWLDSMKAQIAKHNTALFIRRFELV